MLINGKQVQTDGGVKVEDPSTGEVLAEVADASPGQGVEDLDAAVAAQGGWGVGPGRGQGGVGGG